MSTARKFRRKLSLRVLKEARVSGVSFSLGGARLVFRRTCGGFRKGVYPLESEIRTKVLFYNVRYCSVGGVLVDFAKGAVV